MRKFATVRFVLAVLALAAFGPSGAFAGGKKKEPNSCGDGAVTNITEDNGQNSNLVVHTCPVAGADQQ